MAAGCVAENSAEAWRTRWPWSVPRWRIYRGQPSPPRLLGASGDRNGHHDNDIVWLGGATSAHLAHRESLGNRRKPQHRCFVATPRAPWSSSQTGPSGSSRNKHGIFRRRPVFWIGRISGARSVTPSTRQHEPSPSRSANAITSCTCIGPGCGTVVWIKRCRGARLGNRTARRAT